MDERMTTRKRLILFIGLSYAIAWATLLLIPALGLTYGTGWSTAVLAAMMFAPTAANILTRLITKEGFGNMYLRPHFKGHAKEYLAVFFGPTVLIFLSGALFFLIFPDVFDPELSALTAVAASSGATQLTAYNLLLISALQVLLIGPVINIIPTLGEELGWRGYLLPKLRELSSDRAALVITGTVWGVWHLPAIAMGHNYGTDYFGYPWLGILAMIIFCIVIGIVEGYVTIRLKSVIPAAMIHSTINAGAAFPIYLAKADFNPLLGPAMTGLAGGLPFLILAAILFVKSGKTSENC